MQTPRPLQVFIVDDSPLIRSRLAEMLASMSDQVLVGEASNARDAISGIRRTQPDSVVLDLNLMGHTGLDVMRAVRPVAPGVVFVVLTNHSEDQYRQACIAAGASYFLDKSGDFARVGEVLTEIASTRH
ncbi:MAG: response regulator [Usitatibacter sp.]